MIQIQSLCVGELGANCFLVSDDAKNTVIIDPGAEPDYILNTLREKELHPVAILLTHGHFDHFGAAAEIMEQTDIPLYIHELDEPMLLSVDKSMAAGLGFASEYHQPKVAGFRHFAKGDTLSFSEELQFTVLHTPGHTPGGCCFRLGDVIFSGDTLFRQGVGRVDFPGGNIRDMRQSLARLGAIEGDCTVYCGHGGSTTLEYERRFGHYLIPRKL